MVVGIAVEVGMGMVVGMGMIEAMTERRAMAETGTERNGEVPQEKGNNQN